jgi:hypothetical protein
MLVQLPMQNCTILQHYVMHAAHRWKDYWVYFHTQQMDCNLDFPRLSYCQITEDCAEDQQPHEISSEVDFVEAFSHTLSLHFLFVFVPI